MTHEFDRSRWNGNCEPDHVGGSYSYTAEIGEVTGRLINVYLAKNDDTLPHGATYLALAAGQAYPELAFASTLGVESKHITLVDKRFRQSAKERFASEYPELEVVTSGMFAFLESSIQREYTLVTAFGVEYALEEPEIVGAFIIQAGKVLKPGGFLVISPYVGRNPSKVLEANGYAPLSESSARNAWFDIVCVYNGEQADE